MFIARNKNTGTETKVTAEQRDKILSSPLSKDKFTFRPASSVQEPIEVTSKRQTKIKEKGAK